MSLRGFDASRVPTSRVCIVFYRTEVVGKSGPHDYLCDRRRLPVSGNLAIELSLLRLVCSVPSGC